MSAETENVLIVGAGQGGLSASYHLAQAGVPHRVVDRGGVACAWEKQRWDSFCLVTPNWTIDLPGRPYDAGDPDGFMPRDDFVAYMKDWAASFRAPVSGGIDVSRIARDGETYCVTTSVGDIHARAVIVATATYQHVKLPGVADRFPEDILQLNAETYKNPAQTRDGAILVVGSGQTGCQIVEDCLRAGRKTYLCVARTGRLPRRYRGKDILYWQKCMGLLERTPDMLEDLALRFVGDPHLTGRDGGSTVSLHYFAKRGVRLLGRLEDVEDRCLTLKDDLAANLSYADRFCADLTARIDAFIADNGIEAPRHGGDEDLGHLPKGQSMPGALSRLDLDEAGIGTVIWATGFAFDFSWIEDLPIDRAGYPVTDGGASPLDGLFFCGLNWMTKRKSGILYGVNEDGRLVAGQVRQFLQKRAVRVR